jgi:alpha-galactosidase
MKLLRLVSAFLFMSMSLWAEDSVPRPPLPNSDRILFLGNSITLHGPSPKIGWEGNWGMAASSIDKDYVHRTLLGLAMVKGKMPEFKALNIADFERGYENYDPIAKLKDVIEFKPDIIVVAIGENVAGLTTEEKKASFKKHLLDLLGFLKTTRGTGQPMIFVRSCFWANPTKDSILKEDAAAEGAAYVDISALAGDEKNYARSERNISHEGVAKHPGDRGMQAIADALVRSIKETLR